VNFQYFLGGLVLRCLAPLSTIYYISLVVSFKSLYLFKLKPNKIPRRQEMVQNLTAYLSCLAHGKKHNMGICAAQLTCLRKVCGHVTVSDHRLSKPEGFNVSFHVYIVNIANEDKKLQTPADIIP
jgi:hypothetical protein